MPWRKSDTEIGHGKHSTVYLAEEEGTLPESRKFVAVKTANLDESDALKKELGFLDQFRHDPFVVQCFGWDQSLEGGKWRYNLLLEHAPEGNLVDLMNNSAGIMPEALVANYAYMILKGLSSVHSKGIVHCDVRPENILVFTTEQGFTQLKLADFRNSRYLRESDNKFRGPVTYLSPECARHWRPLRAKSGDVWALGCTALWMMSGGKPVWGDKETSDKEVVQMLEAGRIPGIPESVSDVGRDFLKQCFVPDHTCRPTVGMLLRHPFIAKNAKGMVPTTGFEGRVVNPFGCRMASTGLFPTNPVHFKQEKEKKESDDTYAKLQYYSRVQRPKSHLSLYRTSTL